MTFRPLLLLCALGGSLSGCKSEDDPFLPLPALCPQRSEAICAARAYECDDTEADSSCQGDELARCKMELDAFGDEPSLSYDTVTAARVRSEEQAALDKGDGPFALARYFSGGLSVDADCERDSQCETGACSADTSACADAPEASLCEPE